MNNKFSYIDFVNTIEDIPINFLLKKFLPINFLKWYIVNKNIFLIKEMTLNNKEGYFTKILIPKDYIYKDEAYTKKIIEKTIVHLNELGVNVINNLHTYKFNFEDYFYVSSEVNVIPFFICDIIKKYVKIVNKQMKNIKILIIADNSISNKDIDIILDIIYPNINYLSILVKEKEEEYYKKKAEEILSNTGLILQILTNNKSLLIKEADVIINTSFNHKLDNILKSGSLYIDLSINKQKLETIASKREDILFVDNIKISLKKENLTLKELDMVLFLNLNKHRYLNKYKYNKNNIKLIIEYITKNKIYISDIGLLNKWINNKWIERFLNNYNLMYNK